MKVCLLNAPWEEQDKWGIRAGCRFPNLMPKGHNSYVPFPFLIAYTASYLESKGSQVLVIDGVAERCGAEVALHRIRDFKPDLVIAETAATSLRYDQRFLERVRSGVPGVKIALYGSHVTTLPHEGMDSPAVDFVIRGEPELTAHELILAAEDGQIYGSVDGLAWRDSAGKVVLNRPRAPMKEIEALPYPKREGMPLDRYNVPGFPSPVVFMYGSRGCPYKCTFCLWPQTIFGDKPYRAREPEKIVEEMAHVLETYPQTRSFFFDDDTFNLGRARVLRFADEMKRRGIKVPWGMNARADNWDREMLERLIETGLFTLRIGIESGDQAVLDKTKKDLNLEGARRMLEMSDGLGISNHVSFIIGLEGETWESVDRTVKYIKTLPVDSVQFSVAAPFPGTGLHKLAEDKGHLTTKDWTRYNGAHNAVMRTDAMSTDEVMRALRSARRRVYFSPRFVKRRLSFIRNWRDLAAISRKAMSLVVPRAGLKPARTHA